MKVERDHGAATGPDHTAVVAGSGWRGRPVDEKSQFPKRFQLGFR